MSDLFQIETRIRLGPTSTPEAIGRSLRFEYYEGHTSLETRRPHSTGWRALPFTVFGSGNDGDQLLWLQDEENAFPIPEGTCFLIPQGLRHRIDIPSPRGISAFYCHFTHQVLGAMDAYSLFEPPRIIDAPHATNALRTLFADLIHLMNEETEDPLASAIEEQRKGLDILRTILELSPPTRHWDHLQHGELDLTRIVDFIQRNLHRRIDRDELAALSGFSKSRFHDLFREMTGKSPMRFCKDLRLRRAQLLLLTTDHSVKEVAEETGFNSQFHFSTDFKKAFNISPMQYKKSHSTSTETPPPSP